jgi:hypothetical protein
MYRGNSSRLFPIILVLIVIAIAVAALVSIGRVIFGGGSQPDKAQVDTSQQALLDTSATHSVRMTVRGPIVAEENFRSYRITVDASSRNLTTYSGYIEQPIDSKDLSNNTQAYEQFVFALNRANLVKGVAFNDDKDDTRGICATGKVYEFEVIDSGSIIKRLWTSTCKGSPGSFKGSVTQVQNLFLQQIPDNRTVLKKIDL